MLSRKTRNCKLNCVPVLFLAVVKGGLFEDVGKTGLVNALQLRVVVVLFLFMNL